jgi:hypothetical protein
MDQDILNAKNLIMAIVQIFLGYIKIQWLPQPSVRNLHQFVFFLTSVLRLILSHTTHHGTSIHNHSLQSQFCQSPYVVSLPYPDFNRFHFEFCILLVFTTRDVTEREWARKLMICRR